ncbi:hypothetical protein SAMN03080615_02992 [Amphritea atlantica]|uniref:Inner membrane protein YedI n=1 Tax=Amphritea atlantica TaxID=355243 RepID=A0A1H9JG35_9GAMM|nr:DUF808 domain-containing protein [Amphritea atlantica]SEQ85874.1 hypothetical protein SAMN03080615_02992 [Amphritea atlantica]
MAGSSLLALIDDIATLLDDVASMTKVAAGKTAGVLGDDLALNAEQVSGVRADRELPVVWAVAKGSLVNKMILVPGAMAISYFIPWLIIPLLMLGGLYLCFEGFEKVAHQFFHSADDEGKHHAELTSAVASGDINIVEFEKQKIKGAIRTDFILSAEIIVLTLGTVAAETLPVQLGVMLGIALLVTVGVYGLVAGIVKLDDLGLYMVRKPEAGHLTRRVGRGIVLAAPRLMKILSVVGTIAMFLVGGGILVHGLPFLHHFVESLIVDMNAVLHWLVPVLLDAVVGLIAGAVVLAIVTTGKKLFR